MSGKIKKIVCFGGGNVAPKLFLEPLKKYPLKIISIASMFDNGGSTGQLRKDFNILPAGDISRHLIALSDAPKWKKDLFYLRFGREKFSGGHIGHRFGTVFISLAEYTSKDFEKALNLAEEFLEIKKHRALPVTVDKAQLIAELENGKIIEGEDEIDVPKKHNPNLKIKKVFLRPKAKVFPATKGAVKEADLITFGPGDLYSSIICCFLPQGMKDALKKTKAKKVLIVNPMTKKGETNNFSVLDFTNEVEKYIGTYLDYVIYNNKIPAKQRLKKYKKQHPEFLNLVKIDKGLNEKKLAPRERSDFAGFIGKNLLATSGPVEYDSKKVVKIILNL
jgi:uncharacterized cofD-like protein